MRIKRVHIQNFRCLEDIDISFDKITTFIGPNGAGKSTVLRALDWFFNSQKGTGLTDDDCTFGTGSKQISVEVEFCDLTDADRQELGHYVTDGVDKFVAWKYRHEDGSEKMTGNAKTYGPFSAIRNAGNAAEIKTAYKDFIQEHSELGLPNATTKDAILAAMTTWELDNPSSLSESQEETPTNFFGFNSQAKMSGIFDFVFVGADLRASEEVADGKSTIVGRILERAVNRQSADEEIADLTEEVKGKQQEIYDRNFQSQLVDISGELTQAISQYSVGREIKVQTKELELSPPKTQFAISILDNTIETQVARQGHGFQRTMLISALQLLAKRGTAGQTNGTICLAIEEPELFQHPIQAQAFSQVLRNLASDSTQEIQVAYATHSPYFVDTQFFYEVRRVTRKNGSDPEKSPEVLISSTSIEDIKTALNGYVTANAVDSQLKGVCINRLSEALFANSVVLTEGTTDKAIVEGSAEKLGTSLMLAGTVVTEAGNKNNLFLAHSILENLGIPSYVVFDGDKGSAARVRAKTGSTQQEQAVERDNIALNKKLLKYLGATEEDWPANSANDKYAVLEDTLETWLATEWPEWVQKKDEIVSTGLGSPEKNAQVYRLAASQTSVNPPTLMAEIISKVRAVTQ